MGGTASKGRNTAPHRSSQSEQTLLSGHTFADLTGVSEEHQTARKLPVGDTSTSGNRCELLGRAQPVSGSRATRSPGDSDNVYPAESNSDGRSNDSDVLSSTLTEQGPITSLAGGHFVNTETLKPTQDHHGPRARWRYVYPRDISYNNLGPDELISKWRESKIPTQKNDIIQCILTVTIPALVRSQRIAELSQFLKINDPIICMRVHKELMKFLYSSDDDLEPRQILDVEENVWTKLRQMQNRVFDLGLINLLLWSYLLCHPDVQEKHVDEIIYTSEERKKSIQEFRKETQSTMSKDLFKAMLVFHEDFPKRFHKRGGLSLGRDVQNTCEKRDDEILNLIDRAKFCDKFTHLYSLIKQIMASEHDCGNIIAYLKHILPTLTGKGRCGKTQTLSMLLDQGVNHALQTVFGQADVQIGPVQSTIKRDLRELIVTTVTNQTKKSSMSSFLSWLNIAKYKQCCENRLRYILLSFSSLIFHPAKCVRDPVFKILRQFSRQSMLQLHAREIERTQANCRLRIVSHQETDTYIQTMKGRMGNHNVLILAHVPSYENLHNPHAINHFPPSMQSERDRHINNLDMLRRIKSHVNIVELYGYQAKPLPWYYIIEDCQQTILQRVVLEKRKHNCWLSDKDMCNFLFDIVNGLLHLHKQNIVLRDLTLNNFFLVNDRVKIGDLGVSCLFKSKNKTAVRDLYPEDVPTRWTSPEALLNGTFSPQSDIWSLGLVMYCLWTHGCDPYTEHYSLSTAEVMRKVVFEELSPFQWSCIPDCVYVLLSRCMRKDPGERIELTVFRDELDKCSKTFGESQTCSDTSETTFKEIHAKDMFYPVLSEQQEKRHHMPERGIPDFIHEFRKEQAEGFINGSRRNWVWTVPVVNPADLKNSNDLILELNSEGVTVKEILTEEFVKKRLPHIDAAHIKSLNSSHATLDNYGPKHYIQKGLYEDSDTLLNVALYRTHDSDVLFGVDANINRYLHMCLQVAESVLDMHNKGWIHRNLRAKNFLVSHRTREVYTCRVGGMVQVPVTESGTGIVKERASMDSSRWLPPEVLIHDIYSKASDVYMFAMMIYEILQAYQEDNPRKDIMSVPYCLVPQGQLKIVKQNGDFGPIPKPDCCPSWLYNFLVRCWNPDRCQRPTIQTVVQMLRERLGYEIQSHKERLMNWEQLLPSPKTPGLFSRQPRRNSSIDGRFPFRKFRKTMKNIFRPKKSTEPEAGNHLGNTEMEYSYASVNHAYRSEEGEAVYEVLKTQTQDDEEEIIYDRIASRRNTMSRTGTVSNVPDRVMVNVDNITVPSIRMRSHRGRRHKSGKKSKMRQRQFEIRSFAINHSSSSSSSRSATISRRSKRRKPLKKVFLVQTESHLPDIHESKHPNIENNDASSFLDDREETHRKTVLGQSKPDMVASDRSKRQVSQASAVYERSLPREETDVLVTSTAHSPGGGLGRHMNGGRSVAEVPERGGATRPRSSEKEAGLPGDASELISARVERMEDCGFRRRQTVLGAGNEASGGHNGRTSVLIKTNIANDSSDGETVSRRLSVSPVRQDNAGDGLGRHMNGGRCETEVTEGGGTIRRRSSEMKAGLPLDASELVSGRGKWREGCWFRRRQTVLAGGNEASGGQNGRKSVLIKTNIANDSSDGETVSRRQSVSPVRPGNAGDVALPIPQFMRVERIHDNTFNSHDKERNPQSDNTSYLTVCNIHSSTENLRSLSQEGTFVECDPHSSVATNQSCDDMECDHSASVKASLRCDDFECDDGYIMPVSQTGTSIECDGPEYDDSSMFLGKVGSFAQSKISQDDDEHGYHSCMLQGSVTQSRRCVTQSRTSISEDDLQCDHSCTS